MFLRPALAPWLAAASLLSFWFAAPAAAKDRWSEVNVGPFFVDSESDSTVARETLTQLEQLRWVLGGLLESKDLSSVWPIRVVLSDSAKSNPTTAGTEFVLQSGQFVLLTAPGSHLPLGQVAALLIDANTTRMPAEVEAGLQQLFDTLEAHGSHVIWGGAPAQADLAWARIHLFATKFEYSASLHIFVNALKGGSTVRAAERNAFNRDPAALESEAAANLAKGSWQAVSVSGRPLDPKRDFGEHSIDGVVASVYIADSQLGADPKASEAAYKAAVAAGGAAAALGYEGLAQIARLNRTSPATLLKNAIKAGSKSAPVYAAAANDARADEALALLKRAALLNPMWAEPVFRQAEFANALGEQEELIKRATKLDPRISQYWIELARVQLENGHAQAAQGSWLRAEDSARNQPEWERIHKLHMDAEDKRLDAADIERKRDREAPHLADQRAQQAQADRIVAAEKNANQALDAASGTEAPADAVPWNSVVPKKTIRGILLQVDCLHTGVRLAVKEKAGQTLSLYLKDATALKLSCGMQRSARPVSISYLAELDEARHTVGEVTSLEFR